MADDSNQIVVVYGVIFYLVFTVLLSFIIVKGIRMKVQIVGERVFGGDFFVNENVQVEDYPLKMNDEVFRDFADPGLF